MPRHVSRAGRKRHLCFRFRYVSAEWDGLTDHSPLVSVVLSWKGKSLYTKMLFDTGATTTFLQPWVADFLGLELEGEAIEANGAGGRLRVRASSVEIRIKKGGQEGTTHVCPVQVTVEQDAIPYGVLGRNFMHWYEVTIRQAREEIVIREVGDHPGLPSGVGGTAVSILTTAQDEPPAPASKSV